MTFIFWALFAYVLGSIPFGLVIAKSACGIDPRKDGSRNTGATNVARLCGMKYGIATLICDVLKGLLPVVFASAWLESPFALSLVALAAILGHVFSCFMHFKGGKAVATTVGAFLGLAFWPALVCIVLCLLMVWLTGHVSMGSLTFALSLPVLMLLSGNFAFIPVAVVVMLVLFWRHKENIRRLARGEENPWLKKDRTVQKASPKRYAVYSIGASILTLVLKFGAWGMTGSVGLLSDATESLVNLTAGVLALTAITIALRPADADHAYGHGKAEYFSSGIEGVLIIVAAFGIGFAAIDRFLSPQELHSLGPGLLLALASSVINFLVARIMLRAADRFDSITLEADARHLLTDVWTSVGLVAGLAVIIVMPQWKILDPIIAVVMAVNIVFTGVGLLKRSVGGLMDDSLPEEELKIIADAINSYAGVESSFHGLRTRKSGPKRFIDFHLVVPGSMTVHDSHELCELIEELIHSKLPRAEVTIHVEPLENGASYDGKHVGGACAASLGGECPMISPPSTDKSGE